MKMVGLSGDVRNPERHWRWVPISIQMPWRLLLPVCAMLASKANPRSTRQSFGEMGSKRL